jgi:Icc protein
VPRIVQITDLHLFADPQAALRNVCTWPRLLSVMASIRRSMADIDLLVITGDSAHDELAATYRRLAAELADFAGRVRIVPGNHDHRAELTANFPQTSDGPVERITFHEVLGDWQVIGLDSQLPGELPGLLGSEQLDWLRRILREASTRAAALFLHHPPVSVGSPWLDKIGLQDADELAAVLREHRQVKLVMCGHVHQQLAASLGAASVFTTPAVGPAFRPRTEQLVIEDAPPAFRLIELGPGGQWSTQVVFC